MQKEVYYHCSLQLGRVGKRPKLWLKSADFVGDSIVVSFSDQPVEVPYSLCLAFHYLISCAKHCPTKQWSVSNSIVPGSLDYDKLSSVSVDSLQEVTGDE